nr:unnamed protein product [Digitaria exilis]
MLGFHEQVTAGRTTGELCGGMHLRKAPLAASRLASDVIWRCVLRGGGRRRLTRDEQRGWQGDSRQGEWRHGAADSKQAMQLPVKFAAGGRRRGRCARSKQHAGVQPSQEGGAANAQQVTRLAEQYASSGRAAGCSAWFA